MWAKVSQRRFIVATAVLALFLGAALLVYQWWRPARSMAMLARLAWQGGGAGGAQERVSRALWDSAARPRKSLGTTQAESSAGQLPEACGRVLDGLNQIRFPSLSGAMSLEEATIDDPEVVYRDIARKLPDVTPCGDFPARFASSRQEYLEACAGFASARGRSRDLNEMSEEEKDRLGDCVGAAFKLRLALSAWSTLGIDPKEMKDPDALFDRVAATLLLSLEQMDSADAMPGSLTDELTAASERLLEIAHTGAQRDIATMGYLMGEYARYFGAGGPERSKDPEAAAGFQEALQRAAQLNPGFMRGSEGDESGE